MKPHRSWPVRLLTGALTVWAVAVLTLLAYLVVVDRDDRRARDRVHRTGRR